jgi:8-amino-7-oxononanoate synthase
MAEELSGLRAAELLRKLRRVDSPQAARTRIEGGELRNFSSNDYLGLANDPALKMAAIEAVEKFGAGSGSARLICGSLAPHHELEQALASFKASEAALGFSSGYAAALGTICALAGRNDVIVIDRLVHACIVDAARLSGAQLRVFRHNDPEDLERILKWADATPRKSQPRPQSRRPRILVVTESVFSMDGDQAPIRELVEMKEKYGAWLMVDEAHATGLLGPMGRGLVDAHRLNGRVEIQMGTLGKALGAAGGYICGSRRLVDVLLNRARSFVFSTAPVPASSAAAAAALRFLPTESGEERRERLWARVDQFRLGIAGLNSRFETPEGKGLHLKDGTELSRSRTDSAIVPIVIGAEAKALKAAEQLHGLGLFVPAIRYPTVARGKARLRVTLTATHSAGDVQELLQGLERVLPGRV